jgi:hypothetical protein
MAKKAVVVSDPGGDVIEEGKAAKIRITFEDGRRESVEIDATAEEAAELDSSLGAATTGQAATDRRGVRSPNQFGRAGARSLPQARRPPQSDRRAARGSGEGRGRAYA